MREIRDTVLIFSFFLMFGLISGCATPLADPMGPNSSLVVGRVVINNQYPGSGILPIGIVEYGIEVEIESKDGSQFIKATTGHGGYFVVPNISPNTYYLSVVKFTGSGSSGDTSTTSITLQKKVYFTPVPGEIVYLGMLFLDISENFRVTPKSKYRSPNPEAAKAHLAERYPGTLWLTRQFRIPQSQSRFLRRLAPRCFDDPQYRREFPLLCGQDTLKNIFRAMP